MRRLRTLLTLLGVVAVGATVGAAQPADPAQRAAALEAELEGVGITERLGETVPADLALVDEAGNAVTLGDYFDGERPVVVAFVYHSCPMLCSLILDGVTRAMRETNLRLGGDYQALAISFDHEDTPERAAAAKARYLERLPDQPGAAAGWHFLTGTEEEVARVTDAFGFGFRWNERQQEYAHSAAAFFVSPEGELTRALYGIEFAPQDFRTALLEASEGRIGSPVDQLILYCFQYDPSVGSYVLHAQNAMKVGGVLTVLLLGAFLAFFWRRERRREEQGRPVTAP